MVEITDEYMDARLATMRPYAAVFLRKGPAYQPPDDRSPEQASIIREHGRRNMKLTAEGKMAIVGPLGGAGETVGLCVFAVPEDEAREIMKGDGAVEAGIFTLHFFTLHGFPGEALPA